MRQLRIEKKPTVRENDSLDKYLQEVSKIELLTPKEEVELAYKVSKGDDNALNKLVRANLRFVISVAKQYQNQGLSLSDLIDEGNIGLIKAARRFDETRGFKFISYAVWWIRQSILQALAEQSNIVRIPANKVNIINKINKTYLKLEQQYKRMPTTEEIAKELDLNSKDLSTLMGNAMTHISMDSPISDDNDSSLYDVLATKEHETIDQNLIKESLQQEIERVLSTLTPMEAEIIRLLYGLAGKRPHTLYEVGNKYNITKERVRQIKISVIDTIKTRSHILRKYL